jgi:hypothetical protein
VSRSGYVDDYWDDPWQMVRWRGAVTSAIRGKRGQALLREMRDALDAMPEKRLITNQIVCEEGVCALGAVAVRRGLDVEDVAPEDRARVARVFDIAEALAAEIVWMNDEACWRPETPEERWTRMRAWVEKLIEEGASE